MPTLGVIAGATASISSRLRKRSDGTTIADAYTYLPNSVKRFPAPAALAGEMERAGLRKVRYLLLAGGIVAIHAGTVPAQDAR